MRVKIRLDTLTDVKKFFEDVADVDVPIYISDGDSRVNAHSLLGYACILTWRELICECEKDIYFKIKPYIIEVTPNE